MLSPEQWWFWRQAMCCHTSIFSVTIQWRARTPLGAVLGNCSSVLVHPPVGDGFSRLKLVLIPDQEMQTASRNTRRPSHRTALALLIFGGLVVEILADISPARMAILFFLIFWIPLTMLHEAGHAFAARWWAGELKGRWGLAEWSANGASFVCPWSFDCFLS